MNRLDSISFGKIVQIREKLLQQAAAKQKVFRFESGDPSFSIAPHVEEAIKKALCDGKTHYIPNDGIPELRKALAEKCHYQNKLQVNHNDIFITNGAMHALYVTFQCLLEEGDEVVVPEPLWTEIGENIRLAGGKLSSVTLSRQNEYKYTLELIKEKITSKTKAIFVNTPHNPTGAVVSSEELVKIAQYAREHNLYLISDEAYEDLIFEGEHFSPGQCIPDYDRMISIYSFSKSHAMSGLRVGYIVTKNEILQKRIQKILRCTVNGINSLAQWGALAAVGGPKQHLDNMLLEYKKRRDLFVSELSNINGLYVFKPQGAFYLWCEIEPLLLKNLNLKTVNEFSEYLTENGIGNAPGDSFGAGCSQAIRFAFSCQTEMVVEGLGALKKVLKK